MQPLDIGLPRHFENFRPGQFDAILTAATSDKRFNLMSMPTGSGKSLVYMGIAKMLDARVLVLTGTKGLQVQLTNDFAEIGLLDVRGQNNYRCVALDRGSELDEYGNPGSTCDEGPCHVGVKCSFKMSGCLYYDQVRAAAKANMVVTNYMYWMTANRYAEADAIGRFDLLILDEAHDAPFQLAEFCTINLEADEVRILTKLPLPPIDEGVDVWAEWAEEAYKICKARYAEVRSQMEEIGSDRRKHSKMMRRLADLGKSVGELAKAHSWRRNNQTKPNVFIPGQETDWVAEKTKDGLQFSPVWAHAYAEEYLFRNIPKVVFTSATLQPATARYLGVSPFSMDYKEFPSSFDPKLRPFIHLPTTNVDRNMTEGQIRVWINKIDRIIDGRLDRKGILHTRSYDRAQIILQRSRHRHLMLGHGSRNARDTVDRFRREPGPCVLVSPAMETGWDFPYDQCRYQIIAKVPFIDSRSPIVAARARSDKAYLNYLVSMSLVQQYGRGMRAEDDWCETFIIDDHIEWFMKAARKQNLFAKWFLAAYSKQIVIPEAPRMAA